jgi:hypothetical protein
MNTSTGEGHPTGAPTGLLQRWRRHAWVVLAAADVGLGAWGLGAAAAPTHLLGPGSKPILPAGFEGYTGGSWDQLAATSPTTAGYLTLIFRMYGIYIVAFSLLATLVAAKAFRRGERWAWWALLVGNTIAYLSAMTYDRIVGAIGPFEWAEYLGIGLIYASLAITRPKHGSGARWTAEPSATRAEHHQGASS